MRALIRSAIICFCYASVCVGQAIIEPADEPIELSGILRIVHAYGPPGYGANKKADLKINYWALELPVEINLTCTPERADLAAIQCGSTKRPRLFFPADRKAESKARRLVGKQVKVTGSLRRWTTNAEMTPVYVDVADIDSVPRKK